MKITARRICEMLCAKHWKDVFVPQCKTGHTHYNTELLILDAWAMKRSWANPVYWGYEIKVSRSDFLGDDKWQGYMDYCSDFSFVTTGPEIIKPEELPENVGLIYVSKNAKRLITKKKAVRRPIEIPNSLLQYVIMRYGGELDYKYDPAKLPSKEDTVDYWNRWLKNKNDRKEIGELLGYEIQAYNRKKEREMKALKAKIEEYEFIENWCKENGIENITAYGSRKRVLELLSGMDSEFESDIRNASIQLNKLRKVVEEVKSRVTL